MQPDSPRRADTKRVTLTEVAHLAGVSRSAASFALNGRTDLRISAETAARVREAADQLGYSPNLAAKTLRTGKSGTVALVSDFVGTTSFANAMVRGALRALGEADTLLFTVDTQGEAATESRALQNLVDRDVDGLLYSSMFTRKVELPHLARRMPVVLLNCISDEPAVPAVIPDERAGGRTAARTLLEAGHRDDIWFVGTFPAGFSGGAAWHGWSPLALTERLAGIEDELGESGTRLAGTVAIDSDWDVPNGHGAMQQLLATGNRPTAVICANDALAVGVYHALQEAGLNVPRDVSVIGFDGGAYVNTVMPQLTSVALPHEQLGREAVRILLNSPNDPGVRRLPMPLLVGASIGAPGTPG